MSSQPARLALSGVVALTLVSGFVGCASPPSLEPRPLAWAEPLNLEGVPNLHRVDAKLYRSAQPSAQGMGRLQQELGIHTVINLRAFHDDRQEVGELALHRVDLPIYTWALDQDDAREFLRMVDESPGPVLVHCQHGADRTGTLCAVYRMKHNGWSAGEAIEEMKFGGYGFHSIWKHLPTQVQNFTDDPRELLR